MPQQPYYPPIFTQRGRYPGAQYPQQGQIPIFTPPFVPGQSGPGGMPVGVGPGQPQTEPYYTQQPQQPTMPAGGGVAVPPMTMPDGSPVGPADNIRQMTPEEQARFAPDQAPPGKGVQPEPKSGWRKFFDNLTSAPNASALLTMGSILSSAPHPGESPLGQAVRGINGAYSTYGLFAQQRAQQAEQQRKAGLEREKQNNENLRTVSGVAAERAGVSQGDRKLDLQADENANTAELNKQKQEDLKAYRAERLTQQTRELEQANKRLEIAQKQLEQDASQHGDKLNMEGRKLQIQQERDQAIADRDWARIAISKLRTEKDLDSQTYKDFDMALKIAKQTTPISDINNADAKKANLDKALEKVKADRAGGTAPTEGQTATNPTTGAKVVFKGGSWQPVQ